MLFLFLLYAICTDLSSLFFVGRLADRHRSLCNSFHMQSQKSTQSIQTTCKFLELLTRFELVTSSLPRKCSTNWAITAFLLLFSRCFWRINVYYYSTNAPPCQHILAILKKRKFSNAVSCFFLVKQNQQSDYAKNVCKNKVPFFKQQRFPQFETQKTAASSTRETSSGLSFVLYRIMETPFYSQVTIYPLILSPEAVWVPLGMVTCTSFVPPMPT